LKKTPRQMVGSVILSGVALGVFGYMVSISVGAFVVDSIRQRF
jgi:VIT1/CCC1 family predicted Fe2+/Mn2+ transporter